MLDSLDVTGDDIWYGVRLVGRILIPTSSERDVVECLIRQDAAADHEEALAALDKEHDAEIASLEEDHKSELASLEDQLAAAENEAGDLRETLAGIEANGVGETLARLTEALRVALANNDKLRDAARKLQEKLHDAN
jgi:hypothetical protein